MKTDHVCGAHDTLTFNSSDLCCTCGGGTYANRLETSLTKTVNDNWWV